MKTKFTSYILSILALTLFIWKAIPLPAQPCFDPEPPELPCCFSLDRAPPPCIPPGDDCYGEPGRCFAAKGTYWDPTIHQGLAFEPGIHLRWTFNLVPPGGGVPHPAPQGLTYPRGGFEIYRRLHQTSTGGEGESYIQIARIYPATTLEEAIARIPPSLETSDPEAYQAYLADGDCDGSPDLNDLIHLVKIATCKGQGYTSLWWLEGSKNSNGSDRYWEEPFPPPPEFDLRYDDYIHDRDLFIEKNGRWPMSYQFKPLEVLFTAAVDPVIARILGFYFVDSGAADGRQYDYMILAHYLDRAPPGVYCAEILDIGPATSKDVPAPEELTASVAGLAESQPAAQASSEMVVELTWTNYLKDVLGLENPGDPLLEEHERDGSLPLRYILFRRASDQSTFTPLKRPLFNPSCGEVVENPECDEEGFLPDETIVRVPPILIGSMPRPGGDPEDLDDVVWKNPPYYRDNTVVTGKRYTYQVRGMDLFGRYSAPGVSNEVLITDLVGPPAPIVTEATIYQLADPAVQRLPEKDPVKSQILAAGEDVVLRMRWLWPESFRLSHPDLDQFGIVLLPLGIHIKAVPGAPSEVLEEFPSTPSTGMSGDGSCGDGLDNDGDSLIDLDDPDCTEGEVQTELAPACADGLDNDGDGCIDLDDDGCKDAGDPNEDNTPAELFEVFVGLNGASEPVSEVDPDNGVQILEFGVQAFDGNGNGSLLSRSWKVAVRDFSPPSTPGSPRLVREPGPPDAAGRSGILLEWDTSPLEPYVTYLLYRIDRRSLCKDAEAKGGGCSDEALRAHLLENPRLLIPVTAAPLGPFQEIGTFTDRVPAPGLTDEEYLYVLQALDPAGNRSAFSPLGDWILVPDGFPPSKPVIARASGSPEIRIEWIPGPEEDLKTYRLYRTDEIAHRWSKRKMAFLVEVNAVEPPEEYFDADANRFVFLDSPPRPERVQYYRLEAEDRSGNASRLSEWAAAKTVDNDPPDPPAWTSAPAWRNCPGAEPEIFMAWLPPAGAVETRILRRRADRAMWQDLTGWLPALGEGLFIVVRDYADGLDSVDARLDYAYRLEARDGSGNVSSSLDAAVLSNPDCVEPEPPVFMRGDPNLDEMADISDAIFIICILFNFDVCPQTFPCKAAADIDNNNDVDLSDILFLLSYLFLGGPEPEAPFPLCEPGGGEILECLVPCEPIR